jgi:hypothetical protein
MDVNNVLKWIFRAIWVVLLWRVFTSHSNDTIENIIIFLLFSGIFSLVGNDKPKKKD